MLVVVLIQSARVFAVTDQPVDRGEVFALCQLLIQAPENLPEPERSPSFSNWKQNKITESKMKTHTKTQHNKQVWANNTAKAITKKPEKEKENLLYANLTIAVTFKHVSQKMKKLFKLNLAWDSS